MSIDEAQIDAGQAVYTPRTLRLYDFLVLGLSNRLIWKCPTSRLLSQYNLHVSDNHLDVGVGTGYFLDRCRFNSPSPRIGLLDLNPHSLEFAARRIARYRPESTVHDVLKPIEWQQDRFDSVACNYLLHCLPGTIDSKAIVLDHLSTCMNDGGVIFGSTLLHQGVWRGWAARRLMKVYNTKGIFSNESDSLDALERAFRDRFVDVNVEVVGAAALFSARVSRDA